MNFSASALLADVLFGAIGAGAFLYAKKQGLWKMLVIALLLMGYPYFVEATWLLYGIGVALTGALFIFRD
jgi:hypothetical protein